MASINPEEFGRPATGCQMCKGGNLSRVLDLGMQPHSDDFLEASRLDCVEHTFPLRLVSCDDCGLLQIDYFVDPTILYQTNYVYESSITERGVSHYRGMAADIASKFDFAAGSLAVDIGSNVGVLLGAFRDQGFKVLGVDPAEKVAAKANAKGIETIIDFFSQPVAESIVEKYGHAKVVTGTNVFAHLHELDSATQGMKTLLADDGALVIEAPYAVDFLRDVEYDTIYHQHIGYLSVRPMIEYFKQFDLTLFDVSYQDIHGGSMRYFVGHAGHHPVRTSVSDALAAEDEFGVYDKGRLQQFASDAFTQRERLIELLGALKRDGNRIAGISAPAKGNTLLNFCNVDAHYLDFITEKSTLKQGLYTPGTHIPICGDDRLLEAQPDYALILAWNFADEIMKNLSEFKNRGGKFIIPIPYPTIV